MVTLLPIGSTNVQWMEQSSIDTRSSSGEQLYPGDADFTENNAFSCSASHYIIGDYWYTSDLYDDFDDVSTSLHRQNARYAIARDLLTHIFSLDELVDLYHDLTSIDYEVATYEGDPERPLFVTMTSATLPSTIVCIPSVGINMQREWNALR